MDDKQFVTLLMAQDEDGEFGFPCGDSLVSDVEELIGISSHLWGAVPAREITSASVIAFLNKYEIKLQ